jgi:hypothetical protein
MISSCPLTVDNVRQAECYYLLRPALLFRPSPLTNQLRLGPPRSVAELVV